ncbi:GTPase-activating protein [Boothiomyces macroporosus]|uniref:GTPase-activating protein n=1 Tax=Boothiomyces macroporosus TaxID=261099 RepID=A0AAD5UCV2_9FUNG|nr:GTPase-activating protein [Boothiomyces macroporosus]
MPGYPQLITAEEFTSNVSSSTLYFLYLAGKLELILVLSFVSTYISMAAFVYTAEASTSRIRDQYLKAVLRQNVAWFDKVGAGEVATRIISDTLLIQDGIGEKVPLAFSSVATFIAGFVIAFIKSWKLTLVLICVVPLVAISGAVMNVINGKFQTRILALYSQSGNIAEESIAAIRTVTAFNSQKKVSKLYDESLAGARKEGIKKCISTGVGLGSLFFFIYNAYALAFWYGHILLQNGEIKAGSVVNVFFAVLIGAFSLGQLAPDLQAFAFGIGAGAKIFDTINRVPPIDPYDEGGERIKPEETKGRIVLKDIDFTYPSRPDVPILKKYNLTIEPGTTVALVGQSGSGKRFYDPDAGVVELDGRPLKSINLNSLRQVVGLVSQEPVLFEGTVFENVANGLVGTPHEHASDDEKMKLVQEACKQANAHDFILKLQNGYNTQVGERGMLLSGGQKQRVAIARAIIKNPKILLLDEATSALDTTSERVVQAALDNVSKSRTTITIAHRLSTIKNADKIVVMVRGEIIEMGNHDTLVKNGGLYANLVNAQTLKSANDAEKEKGPEIDPDEIPPSPVEPPKRVSEPIAPVVESLHDLEKMGDDVKLSTSFVIREIFRYNMPELKYTIPGLVGAVGSGLIYPFFAISFASIIGVFSDKGSDLETQADFWAIIFVIISVVYFIFTFLQNALFGFASELLTERLRKWTFAAILRQDIAFFDDEKNSTGALTSNLSSDAQKVQGASGVTLGTILQILVNLIGNITVALIYGWKLALVATATLPILVGTSMFRMMIFTFFANKSKEAYEKSAQVACESVAAIKTVQSLTREKTVHQRYKDQLVAPLRAGLKSAILNTPFYAFSNCANFLINALVFWYGGQLIAYEGYTIQRFFTVFVAIIFGAQGVGRVFAYAPDLTKAKDSGENIIKLLNRRPKIDSAQEGGKIENPSGHVKLQNVKFHYPHRAEVKVLKGLDIEVKPGQFAALVGPSGCGKSTTIGLLERFYDPIGGQVIVDGQDISKLNVAAYRNIIGLVSQEPNLFDMTIKENIMFGCDFIPTQEEIEEACKSANIHDFIMGLPDNYNTRVGAKGGQMSGGQKQRIAIARALIKNPKILLLDEATSALDAESEKVVQEALDSAAKGRTTISIAHRLSTIQHADVIFVLKDGVLEEKGTHSELYKKGGVYYELAVQQNLSVSDDSK